ncbi:hypothetical protein CKO36_14460 [Rhabdochromatium marinum]|nr:hypothetical protein [Rhabdochromatium marinum]
MKLLFEPPCRRRGAYSLLALLWLWLLPTSALYAHNLRVFATAEGAWIQGQVYYAGGGAAHHAQVHIYDQANAVVAELTPDAAGEFRWQAEAPQSYRIVADTGEGHRGEWTLAASELASAFPSPEPILQSPSAAQTSPSDDDAPAVLDPKSAASAIGCSGAALDARIEQALARQLRPLREDLARAEDRLALRDLLGGIGWIFGVTGLALWWRGRRA